VGSNPASRTNKIKDLAPKAPSPFFLGRRLGGCGPAIWQVRDAAKAG